MNAFNKESVFSEHQKNTFYEQHHFYILLNCFICTVFCFFGHIKGHGLNVFSMAAHCASDYDENLHTGLQLKGRIDYM